MRKIEVEKVGKRRPVRVHSKGRCDGKGERQHQQVVGVDPQRPLPQLEMDSGLILHQFANVDAADQQGRQKDETLGGRHESDGLIHEVAEARRQMGQRHPDQEKTAQGVEFRTAFQLWQMHGSWVRRDRP